MGVYCFLKNPLGGLIRPRRVADFNYDGHDDILEQIGSGFTLLFGDGTGTFDDKIQFAVPAPWSLHIGETVLAAEFDGAPGTDIVTLASTDNETGVILVLRNDGTGKKFAPVVESQVECNLQDVAGGAEILIDGDGIADILGTSSNLQQPVLQPLQNDGFGTFTLAPSPLPREKYQACLVMDLVPIPAVGQAASGLVSYGASCNDNSPSNFPLLVIRRDGIGGITYNEGPLAGMIPRGIDVGDFNGDGRADLVLWNQGDHSVSIFSGQDNGNFIPASTIDESKVCIGCPCLACTGTPEFVKVFAAELDGDGLADVVIAANSTWAGMQVIGQGPWVWLETKPLLMGDFNEDGLSDFVVRNTQGTIDLLLSNP